MLTALLVVILPVAVAGQGQLRSIKTVHFDIQYGPGLSEAEARKVADYLQEDYSYISDKVGLDFRKRLDVRIHDAIQTYSAQTNRTPAWRAVIYYRGVLHVQPVRALEHRGIFAQSLSFELSIALLEQAVQKGCPRWLRESFAVYHSGVSTSTPPPIGVRLASFADLDQDLQTYTKPPQRNDVLYVLGSTMQFFVGRFGEQKAFSIFRAFDGSTPIGEVFKKAFNEGMTSVERAWAAHITATPRPIRR